MKVRIFVIALFALFSPLFVGAEGYVVTPLVIDVDAEARDIINETITITNNAPYITSIFATVNEISLDEGGGITEFKGPTMVDRTNSITSWIEITRGEINLKPGETREVPVTIRMNPNTVPGEYHALIGFGSGRVREEAETLVQNGLAPRVVVTVRVADKKVEFVDLEGFRVEKFVTENNNQAIRYTLTNPGDTTVVPTGEIVLYDSGGREIKTINANPENKSLEPGQTVELTAGVPVSDMIGKHKAFLNVRYGAGQQAAVYDTAFFYALPWKKLLIIFGVIIFITTLITVLLYRRYMRDDEEDLHDDEHVHSINFKFKEVPSEAKDHDVNLKQ